MTISFCLWIHAECPKYYLDTLAVFLRSTYRLVHRRGECVHELLRAWNFLSFYLLVSVDVLCTPPSLSLHFQYSWLLYHLLGLQNKSWRIFKVKVPRIMLSPTLHICHISSLQVKPLNMCFSIQYVQCSDLGCHENLRVLRLNDSVSGTIFFSFIILEG